MDFKKEKYNIPSIFVILGITGDLANKKIIPSLWQLFLHDLLPEKLLIIGFARRELLEEDFVSYIRNSISSHSRHEIVEKDFERFIKSFVYHSGDFDNVESFKTLKNKINETDDSWGVCTNKLFYLSVPPTSYASIFENLAKVELNLPCGGELGWSRILIEKPFGRDSESAKDLQELLSKYFKEEQIYRIDHYLFKEIVQGIENFRFSNNLFEKNWDNSAIEKIEIKLYESIGAEERGAFYDSVGALRDVGQNHILSILSSLTMDHPVVLDYKGVQYERNKIIDQLSPWTNNKIVANTYRAQYESYKYTKGVQSDSRVETYFSLKTEILNSRWNGVPIYFEAGKKLGTSEKEIVVTLKHPEHCLLCKEERHKNNRIVFNMGAKNEISIHFCARKPGFESEMEERKLSFFVYEKENDHPYVEEYSKVLYDAIGGDQTRFISKEEVLSSWKFVDPIIRYWNENSHIDKYEDNSLPRINFAQENNTVDLNNQIGIIGLGKMGGNIARRLLSKKWKVVGYNRDETLTKSLTNDNLLPAYSIKEVSDRLEGKRVVWLMVPHTAVDGVLDELVPNLSRGDLIIDGGNSPFRDSVRRYKDLKDKGIDFLDVGVSGGPEGARFGSCLMIGGDKNIYEENVSLFKDIAVKDGVQYVGSSGAGHFIKMVHNGIEYGMMQAIGEGFEVIKKSEYNFDVERISDLYNHGSVITSKLIGWLSNAYKKYGNELNSNECCSPKVDASGEGEWTIQIAKEMNIPVRVIEDALNFRLQSEDNPSYTGRVLSALRHEFGGHLSKNCECDKK